MNVTFGGGGVEGHVAWNQTWEVWIQKQRCRVSEWVTKLLLTLWHSIPASPPGAIMYGVVLVSVDLCMFASFIPKAFSQILRASLEAREEKCSHRFPVLRSCLRPGAEERQCPYCCQREVPRLCPSPIRTQRGEVKGQEWALLSPGPWSKNHSSYGASSGKTKKAIKIWLPDIPDHTHYDTLWVSLETGVTIFEAIWPWLPKCKYVFLLIQPFFF